MYRQTGYRELCMLGKSKYVIFISLPQQNWIGQVVTIQVLITIFIILDVSGAFNASWRPSILMTVKCFNHPANIHKLTKSYLSQRTAVTSTNTVKVEKVFRKVCPQGSCFGKGLWNVQYNSLLNLEFRKQTKTIALDTNY
jgi:hypothetical protein